MFTRLVHKNVKAGLGLSPHLVSQLQPHPRWWRYKRGFISFLCLRGDTLRISPLALLSMREVITQFMDREGEAQSAYTNCPRSLSEWSWVLNMGLSNF